MLGNRETSIRRTEKLRLEKMEAGILGTDFIIRTLERPATLGSVVLHRNLAIMDDASAVWAALGDRPTKPEKD